MRFGILSSLFSNPLATLTVLLLAMPGRLLALSAHEAAHGFVANLCGDPTAKRMGRVTLNPLKHIDPLGLICMLLLGFGWAKPVPVNPWYFKNKRRDDLKVALAGITMNLILFIIGLLSMYTILGVTVHSLPSGGADIYRTVVYNTDAVIVNREYLPVTDLFRYGVNLSDWLIKPLYGNVAGWLYDMLGYFVMTNLVLAIFNLIPVPPLDGYHVLNDLILKRPLFSGLQAQRIGIAVLYLASFTGILSKALSFVYTGLLSGLGLVAAKLFGLG